ncbi:uncharacterized protein LOC117570986 [Drosophila albomicans]|uniref:Uncharacterized protein LOC117570986 n=1 Tax=Drosophila albomicans TaxID=7291 RepID=A0A6P8XBQ6_DROAB|nr:uncharacterized protein LOC117570986 [Drosophila albomicans]XP_034108825.1 uncharacterized protein LOC117570986 [Drosophila albomicans]
MASGVIRTQNGFDYAKLSAAFSEICPDFQRSEPGTSQSLDFANKVLFELGPKMRQIKQSGSGQMWRLMFNGGGSVFIYSYTFKNPINVNPRVQQQNLYLTLKQAGLLAASKLCSILPDQHNPRDKVLLTPLARAVFAPQKIASIAIALTAQLGRRVDSGEVIKAVISSCQTDGFHLEHSQCAIAVVAIEVTIRDAAQRQKLRSKTLRTYAKHGKAFDEAAYSIYAQHSKLEKRLPDVEQPMSSTPSEPTRSIDAVLRSIARGVDDPLSGGTLEMSFVEPPKAAPEQEVNEVLPTPIDLHVGNTNLDWLRFSRFFPISPI